MSDFCAPYVPMDLPPRTGFLGTRSSALAVATATITAVTLPTESYDVGGYFTAGAALGTVPAGKAGMYVVEGFVGWASSGLGTTPYAYLTIGGVIYPANGLSPSGNFAISWSGPLNVGDTIALSAYQNSGGSVNISTARLSAYLIGL